MGGGVWTPTLTGGTRHFDLLSRDQQKAILEKIISIQTNFLRKRPRGFTAPAWANSPDLIELLEQHDITYGEESSSSPPPRVNVLIGFL